MQERIVERVDSSYPIDKLMPFCEAAINDDRPAAVNMRPEDWQNRPNTFLYCLYIEKRYDGNRACYYIYRENGKIVAGHGYYPFEADPNMYVQSRVYSIPSHIKPLGRSKLTTSNMLGSLLADKALTQNYIGSIISLEHYNEQLADKIVRITQPHRYPNYYFDTQIVNGRVIKPRHYKDYGLRTQPMKKYGTCMIKGVPQIVIYHLFDEDYRDELFKNLDKVKV